MAGEWVAAAGESRTVNSVIGISVDLAPLVKYCLLLLLYISQSLYKDVKEKPASSSVSKPCAPTQPYVYIERDTTDMKEL